MAAKRPRNRVLERHAAQALSYRYEVTRPSKCPVTVRCYAVGSGICAEAKSEDEDAARASARERVEAIEKGNAR